MPEQLKRYLTVADVAALVELSEKTVMRAIQAGDLEASRLAPKRGGWRITRTAVDRWLARRSNQQPRRRRRRLDPGTRSSPRRPRGQLAVTPDMGRRG